MHVCRYYHDEDLLPEDVREALEETLYAGFVTGEPDRTSAPSALPAPLAGTINRLARTVTFADFTRGNERLSERLAHEAVRWAGERWGELEERDPYAGEEAELDQIASWTAEPGAPDEESIRVAAQRLTARRPELADVAALVERPHAPGGGSPGIGRVDRTARLALLERRWRERLDHDRANHRARLLGRALGGFIRDLEHVVPRLAREQQQVRDALGNEDALWDLSMHEWEELPIAGLEAAANTLGSHPELERLASILGRSRAVTERRAVVREEREVRARLVGIGKSEVTGVRFGADLTSLLPSEVALLARPETEDLFFAKLAHQELLVLDYHRARLVEDVVTRRVATSEDQLVRRGPIIVCVDTSGSMLGLPERIAKATVLALARRLAEDGRALEVIAFSSQVRSFTMTTDRPDLPALAHFLGGGFHGGTDLRRALGAALDALRRRALSHADVLVVSDFRVPKIADRFLELVAREHRRGTLFHALTVAPKPVIDPLHIFDNAWLFSTESGRIAPESLRAL